MPETAAGNAPEIDTSVEHITTSRKVLINLAGLACGMILMHCEYTTKAQNFIFPYVSALIAISSAFTLKAIESPDSGYLQHPEHDTYIRFLQVSSTIVLTGALIRNINIYIAPQISRFINR